MVYTITSNMIPVKNIQDYVDNFMLVCTRRIKIIPLKAVAYTTGFSVYYQDGMELDESDFESTEKLQFNTYPTTSITDALDHICTLLEEKYAELQLIDPDDREEMTIAVCCDYPWNRQVYKYLNSRFDETCPDLTCLDLYQYLKVPSTVKMGELIKKNLNSPYIYPEDPVAFGYALETALGGRL